MRWATRVGNRDRTSFARASAPVAIAVVGIVVLWRVLFAVLSNDRGLDITDEGLYLLAADPPSSRASWIFPFGWHTRPLFRAVGYDIADFRTLGAVILVVVTAWLGWIAVSLANEVRERSTAPRPTGRTSKIAGASTGAIGSLLYYAGLLRTPSYNWVNLVGITVAAAASLALVLRLMDDRPSSAAARIAAVVAAFGIFFTIPAKPSTAPLLLLGSLLLMTFLLDLQQAIKWTAVLTSLTAGFVALAATLGLWSRGYWSVYSRGFGFPGLDPTQTPRGAIKNVLESARYPFEPVLRSLGISATPRWASFALLIAVTFVFGVLAFLRSPRFPPRLRGWMQMMVCLTLIVAAVAVARVRLPFVTQHPLNRWIYTPLVTACVLFVLAAATWSSALEVDGEGGLVDRMRRIKGVAALIGYLASLPLIFGFGSGHGAYPQASLAAGILLIAAVVAGSIGRRPSRVDSFAVVSVALTVAVTATTLYDSHRQPYRVAPIADQDVTIDAGRPGGSLMVDTDLADVLDSLRTQAAAAGWTEGMPLVGLEWRWSSTVPYELGARVPESLMLTLFGYGGSEAIARYNLESRSTFPWEAAWVLRTPAPQLGSDASLQIQRVEDDVEHRTGRAFPNDYECVASAGNVELWRPRAAAATGPVESANACPPAAPPSSNYDSNNGWRR